MKEILLAGLFSVAILSGFAQTAETPASNAETITVTGRVTDAHTGKPLLGAQIRVAEKPYSAMTDESGAFMLKAPSTDEVLLVKAPDYALREIPLRGATRVAVTLYPDNFVSGYENAETLLGEKRQSFVTNSAVTATDFSNSASASFESDVQTRLSDVRTITRSGFQGVGAAMFVRGLNSFAANAQPLVIIDGVPWDSQLDNGSIHLGFFSNPFANVDVRDIESITVLKDGNTIYGSKGSNGVLLINTRRGKDMTTRITANLSWDVSAAPRLPKMMNASEYRAYASNQVQGLLKYYNSKFDEETLLNTFPFLNDDQSKSTYYTYHNDTQWTDQVYQTGSQQNYSLSVNGGDEIALYNLSMGYMSGNGVVKNTGVQRFNARFNSDIKLAEKLFTKFDISFANLQNNVHDQEPNLVTSPEFISLIKAPILAPYQFINGVPSPTMSNYDNIDPTGNYNVSNPLALVENAMGTSSRLSFRMRLNPYWNITPNFTLGTTFGYGFDRIKESFFIPEAGIAPFRLATGETAKNEVRDKVQRQSSLFNDTRAEWRLTLNDNNRLNLLGGFRYFSDSFESDLPQGYNTGNDHVKVLVSDLTGKSTTGISEEWKSLAWYAQASYDYKYKYFLTAMASTDASSRFGKKAKDGYSLFGQRWAFFPALQGAWLVSSEEFMRNICLIDFLKLRAGYSLTGNDDIDNSANRAYFASVHYLGNAAGLRLSSIENDEIQWETTGMFNAGLDIHLMNERLSFTLDFFNSKTYNLLTLNRLNEIAGLDYYWSNGGELSNRGLEFSVNVKAINLPYLRWELGAGVAHYKNKITALPDGFSPVTKIWDAEILTQVGQPAGVFYGYKTDGVFATTAEAEAANLNSVNSNGTLTPFQAGDMHFVNLNGDNIIDERDKTIIGDPNPDLYGTLSSSLNVKRFTLDILFNYSYGNDVYNYLRYVLESGDRLYNQSSALAARWSGEGMQTSIPRAEYGDPMGNSRFSDRWIEDGSYLRLKTLMLSYKIPFNLPYLQGITLWGSANNLWTLTKYVGSDPEFSINNAVIYQGIDIGLTPVNRSFSLGVKIDL